MSEIIINSKKGIDELIQRIIDLENEKGALEDEIDDLKEKNEALKNKLLKINSYLEKKGYIIEPEILDIMKKDGFFDWVFDDWRMK